MRDDNNVSRYYAPVIRSFAVKGTERLFHRLPLRKLGPPWGGSNSNVDGAGHYRQAAHKLSPVRDGLRSKVHRKGGGHRARAELS